MIRGILYMVTASALFAAMGAFVYQVKIWDPSASPLTASFARVVVNLFFVILLASKKGLGRGILDLFGDMRGSLWARGFFGALSIMSLFTAIHLVGLGEASFLHSFNAVWIAVFSPFLLGQPHTRLGWGAIILGLMGLYLMFQPEFGDAGLLGRSVALASGVFAGTAYMMIARAGRSNPSLTVVFYFCLVATLMHLAWFYVHEFDWPVDSRSWILLITAGLFGSIAQIFMTKAYQIAPAAIVSAASYTTPVFNLIVGAVVFSTIPNSRGLLGAALVLVAGVALPFLRAKEMKPVRGDVPAEMTDR